MYFTGTGMMKPSTGNFCQPYHDVWGAVVNDKRSALLPLPWDPLFDLSNAEEAEFEPVAFALTRAGNRSGTGM